MRSGLAVAALILAAAPAWAQGAGPAPTRSDMAPAAPTATSGPDAGQSYQYPPNTGAILPPNSRTPYDTAPAASATRPNDPVPKTGIGTAPRP